MKQNKKRTEAPRPAQPAMPKPAAPKIGASATPAQAVPTAPIPPKPAQLVVEPTPPRQPAQVPKAEPVKTHIPISAPARATSSSRQPKSNRVLFELNKPEAKAVYVAGDFNGWKPDSTPLSPAGNGRWVGNTTLQPGRHEYLFVVDGQWLPDPNAKELVDNPFGGKNSVLEVAE